MDNDVLPPEGTFSRLMSMDKQPDKPAVTQAARQLQAGSSSDSKVPNNKQSKETKKLVSKQANKEASKVVSKKTMKEPFNEDGIYASHGSARAPSNI
jgi:hypothetical protein